MRRFRIYPGKEPSQPSYKRYEHDRRVIGNEEQLSPMNTEATQEEVCGLRPASPPFLEGTCSRYELNCFKIGPDDSLSDINMKVA